MTYETTSHGIEGEHINRDVGVVRDYERKLEKVKTSYTQGETGEWDT